MVVTVSRSGSKEENSMRPYFSRDNNNGIQGQELLGHCLQLQGIMSENFEEYPRTCCEASICGQDVWSKNEGHTLEDLQVP